MMPVMVILLWVKPVGRELLCGGGMYWSRRYLYDPQFESLRLVMVVATVLVRFFFFPLFMQSHLNMAYEKVSG
jgi:hypothetical protein